MYIYIYKFIVKHIHDKAVHYTYQPLKLKKTFFKMFLKRERLVRAGSNVS